MFVPEKTKKEFCSLMFLAFILFVEVFSISLSVGSFTQFLEVLDDFFKVGLALYVELVP